VRILATSPLAASSIVAIDLCEDVDDADVSRDLARSFVVVEVIPLATSSEIIGLGDVEDADGDEDDISLAPSFSFFVSDNDRRRIVLVGRGGVATSDRRRIASMRPQSSSASRPTRPSSRVVRIIALLMPSLNAPSTAPINDLDNPVATDDDDAYDDNNRALEYSLVLLAIIVRTTSTRGIDITRAVEDDGIPPFVGGRRIVIVLAAVAMIRCTILLSPSFDDGKAGCGTLRGETAP
jgi:hypothetical protein